MNIIEIMQEEKDKVTRDRELASPLLKDVLRREIARQLATHNYAIVNFRWHSYGEIVDASTLDSNEKAFLKRESIGTHSFLSTIVREVEAEFIEQGYYAKDNSGDAYAYIQKTPFKTGFFATLFGC